MPVLRISASRRAGSSRSIRPTASRARFRLVLILWLVLGKAALLAVPSALARPQADGPRRWPVCQLEQVLASRQHLRMFAKLVTLGGERVLGGRPLALRLRSRTLRCEPPGCVIKRQRFADQREHRLELALLLEAALSYKPIFSEVQAALSDFTRRLPPDTQLFLFPLGAEPSGTQKPLDLNAAHAAVQKLGPSSDVEIRLIDSIQAALASLRAQPVPKTARRLPARRVIVVVGSGLDTIMVPQRFAQLGDALAQAEVPLFSIALSPKNYQLPMLNLAELSWRSMGTFRWVRLSPEGSVRELLREQLVSLAEELDGTEVVTFSGPQIRKLLAELPNSSELALDCGEALSRLRPVHRLPQPDSPRRWSFLIILALAGLGLFAAFRLGWLRKRFPIGQ